MAALVQQPYDFLVEEETLSPPSTVPGADDTNDSSDFVSSPDNFDYDSNIKQEPFYAPSGYPTPVNQMFLPNTLEAYPQQQSNIVHEYSQNFQQFQLDQQGKGNKSHNNAIINGQTNIMSFVPQSSPEPEKKSKVTAKRAEQNRQAQKTFRERKMKYVKDLEDKLAEATKHSVEAELLKQENEDLRNVILSLKQENERLKTARVVPQQPTQQLNFVWDPLATTASLNKNSKEKVAGQDVLGVSTDAFLSSAQSRTLSLDFTAFNPNASGNNSGKDDFSSTSNNDWDLEAVLLGDSVVPSLTEGVQPPTLTATSTSTSTSTTTTTTTTTTIAQKTKRSLEEAKIYNTTAPFGSLAPVFSKDEDANRDDMENQLCDLLRKIHCKDKNPASCQGSKFVKKAS